MSDIWITEIADRGVPPANPAPLLPCSFGPVLLLPMIAIIDYGMGNLRSVQKGFEKVGHEATSPATRLSSPAAAKVVLPGVGAFGDAMDELRKRSLSSRSASDRQSASRFSGSASGSSCCSIGWPRKGRQEGLGILPGEVVRFDVPRSIKCRTWAGTSC